MSFPRYPSYKDSGVEWWGDMPEGWGLFPAKRSFIRKKELNAGMKCENRLSLTLGGVVPRALNDLDGLQASEFETYQIFLADDLVFKLIDLQNIKTSRVGLVSEMGIMSPAYIRVEPNKAKITPQFAYWFFTNLYNRCIFNELGGGVRQTISSEELLLLPYPTLPLAEQTQIAAFLDRETAKIDELVAEQRRLMELLKEKRQAVISHAVTQGLNPHAPMKPSGIEWLGDVPAHWEVKRLKQLSTKLTDGEHISPVLSDEGVPLLSAKDVRDWLIDYEVDKFVTLDNANLFWKRCRPERGDVLVVSRGATVGRIGVVESGVAFCLMGSVILCKPKNEFEPAFLYFALNAKYSQTSLWFSSASSAQQAIYIRDVAEVPVPVPPPKERTAICSFLKADMVKFDTLTTEAQRAIDLLQERRTALISAAVTGQIDVRRLASC